MTHAKYLRDLANRIYFIPATHGVDESDVDQLGVLARELEGGAPDLLTQLCSELADLTERNARQDAALEEHVNLGVSLCETLGVSEIDQLADRAEQYVDAVDGAYEKITGGAEKSGDPEKLGDRIDRALDEAYDRDGAYQRASDALRRYLVRQGLPADPVRLDDPDLWALYEALSDS